MMYQDENCSGRIVLLQLFNEAVCHAEVIMWKYCPHYWPFVRGIYLSEVYSPLKGTLMQIFDYFFFFTVIWYDHMFLEVKISQNNIDKSCRLMISQQTASNYSDVSWASWYLKSMATWLYVNQLVQANDKENTQSLHYWPIVNGWQVDSPHKGPVMLKMFPCHAILMTERFFQGISSSWSDIKGGNSIHLFARH